MKTLIAILLLTPLFVNAGNMDLFFHKDSPNMYIAFTGDIVMGDNQRLKTVLAENPTINGISLDSPGGNTYAAKMLAQTIRENNLVTFVGSKSSCASACVNVFLGGTSRIAFTTSRFGIHPSRMESIKASSTINDVFNDGQAHAIEYAYEWAKYVDTGKEFKAIQFLRHVYNKTSYKSMYWANPEDLKELSVITRLAEK